MTHLIRRTLAVAAATLFAAGCASAGQEDPEFTSGTQDGIVVVDNTNTTMGAATIYLVPENGVRDQLGTVNPNDEATFTVDPDVGFRYRLMAEVGVDELVSREFTFTENSTVEWDLYTNTVSFSEPAG